MGATLELDIKQVKKLINQFGNSEKEELSKYLDKITLKTRFEKFLLKKKNIPISYEKITEEVEKVRGKRYK
ncbi:hypothetical protein HY745_03460 [Candidatus Desantisbacteria bacterium]|nr:hypothetical protein [Candidatus Desantisbacteria bacterium]